MTVRNPAVCKRIARARPPKPLPMTAAHALSINHRDFLTQRAQLAEGVRRPAHAFGIQPVLEIVEAMIEMRASALSGLLDQTVSFHPRFQIPSVGQLARRRDKFPVSARVAVLRGASPHPGRPRLS